VRDSIQEQRRVERELRETRQILDVVAWGTGAPAFTPTRRALYIRLDGGANTTLYVWEGTAWAAK
jgi:hypothetical protein